MPLFHVQERRESASRQCGFSHHATICRFFSSAAHVSWNNIKRPSMELREKNGVESPFFESSNRIPEKVQGKNDNVFLSVCSGEFHVWEQNLLVHTSVKNYAINSITVKEGAIFQYINAL
jgi:hypothetical protein